MSAAGEPARPPGRLERRQGIAPHADFGRDDADLIAEVGVVRTVDHHHWDVLLIRPRDPSPGRDDTLVLIVHGSMGNYLSGFPRRAAFVLAQHGFGVMSVNTRMANYGVIYGSGLLDRVPLDLDAAMDEARRLGFRRIVLMGHSLGGVVVTSYQALRRPPEVVGVCTLAQPVSLRDSLRDRWERFGATPGVEDVEALARAAGVDTGEDTGQDDVVVVRRGAGPRSVPEDAEVWSLRCWWRSRGPEAECGRSDEWIGRIGVPLMLVRAGDDPVIPIDSAHVLERVARGAGVPTRLAEIEGADHSFWGRVPEALEPVVDWIDGLSRPAAPARPPAAEPRARARLLTVRASDGLEHDALLHHNDPATDRRAERTGRRTAIVHVHGNQGNFTVGALRFLHPALAAHGVPVLALDTRVGNTSQIFAGALLERAVDDIEGAVALLGRLGYDGVIVSGYSLGASIAVRAAAGPLPLPLRGLVTIGASADLAASTRRLMERNDASPTYEEVVEMTRPVAGRPQDDFPIVIRRVYLPGDEPRAAAVFTARTWWHSRGPAAREAQARHWMPRVGAPALLIQGDADAIVGSEDAERLGSMGEDAEVSLIPGADHSFHGYEQEVVTACADWLDRVA